jgi:predicted Zn-ribbon and HTH transcriptional regulator
MKGVDVKCRKCGRVATSDTFVLDHVFKMMVCPACVKERKYKERMHEELSASRAKPIEAKQTVKPAVAPEPVEEKIDVDRQKRKCAKCGYLFSYNVVKKTPQHCPYCDHPIDKN